MSRITRRLQSVKAAQRAAPDMLDNGEGRKPPFASAPTTPAVSNANSAESKAELILAGIRKLEDENRKLRIQLEMVTTELERLRKENIELRSGTKAGPSPPADCPGTISSANKEKVR